MGHHTRKVSKGIRLGFCLMILSEIMFFFSFFWTLLHYSLCLDIWMGQVWFDLSGFPPCHGTVHQGTAFLIVSSWWISEAKVYFAWGKLRRSLFCLTSTLWCGFMFLIIQREEFLNTQLTMNDSCIGSTFYILTGFHCIHVIIGMVFIFTLYFRLILNKFIPSRKKHILFDITVWYWHFVDYVWIALFLTLYCYTGLTPSIN